MAGGLPALQGNGSGGLIALRGGGRDGRQPPSGGNGQFPGGNGQFPSGGFDPAGSAQGTGGATGAWLLAAASALVLAAGIWIAVKKRY